MLTLYKVLLGPVLLIQARRLRRNALRLPEATGTRSGVEGCAAQSPPLRILVVGDSSAAGVGVDKQDLTQAGGLAAPIKQAREAALADPEGRKLAQALGLPVPEPAFKPINFVRNKRAA